MIEYEYESLFAHHTRASVLIVQHGAELEWNSTTHEFDVTGSDYVIKNPNIDSESLNLDEKLCSRDNLKFGLCESANLEFIIYNREIPNLKDEVIDVYVYFNNDGNTLFQVGVYQVDEDTYSAGRTQRNISAYDWNFQLNGLDITKWYNNFFSDNQRHTVNSIIESLFAWVKSSSGGDVPVDLEAGYELCNGTFSVGKTIESDTITFGYFMEGLLEFNGAFGHISRTGTFKFITMEWYDKEPVRVITDRHRYPPTNYDDVNTWGIGQIDVYDRTNVKKFSVQNTNKRHPSIYVMIDPWIIADRDAGDADVLEALTKMHNVVNHYNYNPSETECSGDLCVEVGDRINVEFRPSTGDTRTWFRSYVLERHFSGLQGMVDVYSAKGDKKQPKYKISNDRWHVGDSSSGLSNISSGGVSRVIDDYDEHCIRKDRNKGFRYLDEPSNAVCQLDNNVVKLKWTDPSDLTDDKPVPCIWAKTYVVKREGQPARNIYEGEIIETSTTRDEYSSNWFEDSDIEENKQYYYSIMPEDTKEDVRWTLCFSVNTYKFVTAPTISDVSMSGSKVVVTYSIPEATYSYIKLVYKKGSIPTSYTDGTAVDITQSSTSQQISGIADGGRYYFVIFASDGVTEVASDPDDCLTGLASFAFYEKLYKQDYGKYDAFDLFKTISTSNKATNSTDESRPLFDVESSSVTSFVPYLGSDTYMLVGGRGSNGKKAPTFDTSNKIIQMNTNYSNTFSYCLIPINQLQNVYKIKAKIKFDSKYNQYSTLAIGLYYVDGNALNGITTPQKSEIYIYYQISGNYNTGTWYDVEATFSSILPKCDYIGFGSGCASASFKDIQLITKE